MGFVKLDWDPNVTLLHVEHVSSYILLEFKVLIQPLIDIYLRFFLYASLQGTEIRSD